MKHKYKILFPIAVFIVFITGSCEIYNPAEPIPSYIHIQKIDLAASTGQGTSSSKITDAWLYVDDQLIGCFELPATIPVLYEGVHDVKVRPGIKVDGIATNRAPYPFFNIVEQAVDLQKATVSYLHVTTTYTTQSVFTFMSDFESTGVTIDTTTGKTDNPFQILYSATPSPDIFEGTHSSIAYTDPIKSRFECETVTPLSLPGGGAPVFLEFNYKCNYQFTVSIYGFDTYGTFYGQSPVINLNPSPNWNKIYVYLTPTISTSAASGATTYKVAWGMLNNTGVSGATFSMDNIKVINNPF